MFSCYNDLRDPDNPNRHIEKKPNVNRLFFHFKNFKNFIKDKSPLQAHIRKGYRMKKVGRRIYKTALSGQGSASLEAAIVIPIFLFAMLGIMSAAGAVHVRSVVYEALHETVLYIAEYSYLSEQIEKGADAGGEAAIIKDGLSVAAASMKLDSYIDDKELVSRYVDGGVAGLRITQAELKNDDCVYIKLTYDICIEVPLVGRVKIPCEERIRQRAYLGYDKENDADSDGTYVYVAENGSVYHNSRSCFHIKLSIRQVAPSEAEEEKKGLSQCSLCVRYKGRGTMYVTKSGDKYHYSLECPGLKRTVYRVKKDEAGVTNPCADCSK